MQQELNRNRINELKKGISTKQKEYNLYDIWNYLMIHYGYIPKNEFLKMDAYDVDELIERLNQMNEEKKTKERIGRKNR